MKTIFHKNIYASDYDSFNLWHITDAHVGAKSFAEKLFKQHVQQIADDENAIWLFGGDAIDAICQVGDKRYKPETIASWALGHTDILQVQADYFVELIRPIIPKLLAVEEGNHEWSCRSYYARDIYAYIVSRIADIGGKKPGELALGAGGFVSLNFRRQALNSTGQGWNYNIYTTHGYGGGRLPGGHALTLGRVLGDYNCDLALLGHRHVLSVISKSVVSPHFKGSQTHQRFGVFMPSYLQSTIPVAPSEMPIDLYPELIGLPATPLGSFPIEIYPGQRKVTLHVNYAQGV